MKAKTISIIILILLIGFNSSAQNTYQTFKTEGFKIKWDCQLKTNSIFIKMATQQGVSNILASYVCAENQESSGNGVITNINIYDESINYESIPSSSYAYFEKQYLEQYLSKTLVIGPPKTEYVGPVKTDDTGPKRCS